MLKNIVLSFLLTSLIASGLDATRFEMEERDLSRVKQTSQGASPYPITKKYMKNLAFESFKKMFDIFEDNIKVGAGGSEVRLQLKLMGGYVTLDQLAESAAYKKTGKLALDISGGNITDAFRFAYPEEITQASDVPFVGFKRPSYIPSSSGLWEKALGNFIANCAKKPSLKTFDQEMIKFIKSQLVAIGIATAGYYYHNSGYQAPDYATDEAILAYHMAAGGAFAHFAGTILLDLSQYYVSQMLSHPLMTPEGFYEAARAQEKRLKRAARKTKEAIKANRDTLIEFVMPATLIPSDVTRADLLKKAAYNATLKITYELGAHLGEAIHIFNTLGHFNNPSEDNDRQAARECFGSMAAQFSYHMMNGCGIILSKLSR